MTTTNFFSYGFNISRYNGEQTDHFGGIIEVAKKKATNKKSNRSFIIILTLVVIAAFTALFFINRAEQTTQQAVANYTTADFADQPVLGNPNAPISVVEFGDFKCPSCKQWTETIFPQLKADYIDTGKINFHYVNVIFHGNESVLASLVAEAVWKAEPDLYWALHEKLYAKQSHEETLTQQKVEEIVNEIDGLAKSDKWAPLLDAEETKNRLATDQSLVTKYGIEQTPTIMINGVKMSNPFDYEAIKAAIEQ